MPTRAHASIYADHTQFYNRGRATEVNKLELRFIQSSKDTSEIKGRYTETHTTSDIIHTQSYILVSVKVTGNLDKDLCFSQSVGDVSCSNCTISAYS